VTPAHDPNDYEIGTRHALLDDVINVMAPDASISDKHGWGDVGGGAHVRGARAARRRASWWCGVQRRGLLEEDPQAGTGTALVGHSYRSHAAIEPYLSDQWYVKVTDDRLAGAALRAMNPSSGRTLRLPVAGVGPKESTATASCLPPGAVREVL
jgi:valyl-tRNA synthetase